ncbi:Uu.00g059870.m01.CDS01 [Anthostomella pinea]|uniref:Uu.00g059870.m01.CDS01 n=1 Tax=Anthostomella pinea TaxID=933095 RepID=A0AAI8VS60_9PEZI|nr:Uu.00g059870.m01.CDS01 [Anthostomella pinea]
MASPATPTSLQVKEGVDRVKVLLRAKDDTSRFCGLTWTRGLLNNSEIRENHDLVYELWTCISPRFLDRLIRTGSQAPSPDTHERHDQYLNLAVDIIHAFAALVPSYSTYDSFHGRIPNLVRSVRHSSDETIDNVLGLLETLVQQPKHCADTVGGATILADMPVEDWEILINVDPRHVQVFNIFYWAWTVGSDPSRGPSALKSGKISQGLRLFASSFVNTPATGPLLNFVASIVEDLYIAARPSVNDADSWLIHIGWMVQRLSTGKQSEEGRSAYINCAAALLRVFPEKSADVLFGDDQDSSKPFAYIFVSMVQVDFHSAIHLLQSDLTASEYSRIAQRLASALDVLTSFVGCLIERADQPGVVIGGGLSFVPEKLLKYRDLLVRAVSDATEYLQDQQAAISVAISAEAQGMALKKIFADPLTESAIRFIALWLREDNADSLTVEAASTLMDVFKAFYIHKTTSKQEATVPELRLPILAILEVVITTSEGRSRFFEYDWFNCFWADFQPTRGPETPPDEQRVLRMLSAKGLHDEIMSHQRELAPDILSNWTRLDHLIEHFIEFED